MFDFLSDIVESVGDVILGERGSGQRTGKVAQIGATLAGAPPDVAALAGKTTTAFAAGGGGQAATSSPTPAQSPRFAPESARSSIVEGGGVSPFLYQGQVRTAGMSLPEKIERGKDIAIGMGAGEIIEGMAEGADIVINKFFGGDTMVCGPQQKALISVRTKPDGSQCLSVTRKQQHQLKQMVMYLGIQGAADVLNLNVRELAMLLVKKFPPRRKGISAAQLRTAKRVNRQVMGMAKQLQDACKTTTRRR